MLQAIRDKAQGWIAWVIVILISIPFALFGIQEYLGVDSNPPVAQVNGDEISTEQLKQRMFDFRENMRRTLGDAFTPELFEDGVLESRVLQRMVDEVLLRQAADDWNMRISDAHVAAFIRSLPALQNGGQFDTGLYEATVRSQGLTRAGFEALIRTDLGSQQQEGAVRNTVLLTDAFVAEQVRLQDQKRSIRYVRVPASDFLNASAVTDEEARSYYESHQEEYAQPEQVKVAYIRLSSKALTGQVEVEEGDLREYFDIHRGELLANQERKVRHILIESSGDDDQEKLTFTEELMEQLRGGADFAEMAARHSNDPGSSEDGGDLGWVNRGVMVQPFEDAVFTAQKDELIGPVRTEYGYHIILVTEVRGGEEATFEEVRGQVEKAYRQQQAEEIYYDYHERLADLSYETPDSLVPVAEALGLEIKETDWITRNSRLPALDSPKALNVAFSDDVLQQGNNSDVIDLSTTEAAVLRVREHRERTIRPFDSVQEQVRQKAAKSLAADKARAEGEKLLAGLKGGESVEALIAGKGWESRQATVVRGLVEVPAEVVDATFSVPSVGFTDRAVAGVVSAEGDYFLVEVTAIEDGNIDSMDKAAREQRADALTGALADLEFSGMLQALRERADIEILLD